LGLGLYLSREFVTRHGGDIWVESQPGQGSAFYVALPLEQPAGEDPAP
jgi:signal transduction histidine kinase